VPAEGTVAVIWILLLTENEAFVPLNLTDVVPRNSVPDIMTLVPTTPDEGVNPVIVGGVATLTVNEASERLYGDSEEFRAEAAERREGKLKQRMQRTTMARRFIMNSYI
jgi:hypothetical protein